MTELQQAIAAELEGVGAASLRVAARQLSDSYRQGVSSEGRPPISETGSLAYLATRAPATAAAAQRAFVEVSLCAPQFEPQSQLDLGAGPGAAAWAAEQVWPSLDDVTLIERDEAMAIVGRRLRDHALERAHERSRTPVASWNWRIADITAPTSPGDVSPFADLVTACYVLGELDHDASLAVAEAAWSATRGCLVVVEPGTVAGYSLVLAVRERLLAIGARLIAPCPSEDPCPIGAGDWCHFAARVPRSSLHRQLKDGERSFEDEKFSYVAFIRSPPGAADAERAPGRVIRRPVRRRRLVQLTVCRGERIETLNVGQSHAAYRAAVELSWGDALQAGLLRERPEAN